MTTPSPLSPVVFGGSSSESFLNAINLNQGKITQSTDAAGSDRFWASGIAYANDPVQEVLEIDFASAGVVNRLTFDAVLFPHSITIEYMTSATDDVWKPLPDSSTKQPVTIDILTSYPPVLSDPSTLVGHLHPQHDFEGHWTTCEVSSTAVTVQKLRIILQRNGGQGPVDISGNAVPYSLGIQNLDVGYRISEEGDIPFHLEEPLSDTSGQVFANSMDLFGSNLGFSKKTHKADNLRLNTNDSAPLIWKSEPQPTPNAVVNFYADLRDANGNGQVIDRIFLDPLYLGCSVNLYYSNDALTGDFASPRKDLTPMMSFNGAAIDPSGNLNLGTWHPDTVVQVGDDSSGTVVVNNVTIPAHFDQYAVVIDNTQLGFDPSLDWWVGLEWIRDWNKITDSLDHDLFSCDAFSIGQNQNYFYLQTVNGDRIQVENFTLENIPAQIFASYFAGRLTLAVLQGTEVVNEYDDFGVFVDSYTQPHLRETDAIASVNFSSSLPKGIVIGTNIASLVDPTSTVYTGGQITSFVLGQGPQPDPSGYLNDPHSYSLVPLMATDEANSKNNVLARFDQGQAACTNTTGFIGGPAFPYEDMTWTPIPRTYEMQRGYMRLPQTKAKFWNLEISNLRPQNNEKFVPVKRRVKFFPASLFPPVRPTTATERSLDDNVGLAVQQQLATTLGFHDSPQYVGTGEPLSGITDTEVYVSPDPEVASRLASTGHAWRYEQFHADSSAPRFQTIGKHVYDEQEIVQVSNVSYFAGLRNIAFSKTVRTAPSNPSVIEESFLDGQGVATSNWSNTDLGMTTGTNPGQIKAQATSVIMPTHTGLRGLQFAVQQSEAKIIDIGGDFSNPTYDPADASSWTAYGDGKVLGLDYKPILGGYAFHVSRQSDQGYWADIPLNWGADWATLEGTGATFGSFKTGTTSYSHAGGLTSQAITTPFGGQLHAAVRATASQSLSKPLFVQIVDVDTEQVLAESQSNVSKNEVKQWYTTLDLDDLGGSLGRTWGRLTGSSALWPSFVDTFTRANSTSLGTMDSGQTWTTNSGDTSLQISSNKGVCVVASARNYLDTGTPFGILSVNWSTLTTTVTHSAAVPVLDLGGLILMNDATIMDTNSTVTLSTLPSALTTATQYNFYFMLTSQVPGGQLPGGTDASIQPYSLKITTGTLGSDTWIKTVPMSRAFTSLRAITGPINTAYTLFSWSPSYVQDRQTTFIGSQFAVSGGSLTTSDNNMSTYTDSKGKVYTYQGQYTYTSTLQAVRAASLNPSGTFVAAPTAPSATPAGSGGMFTAGTYYYKVTSVNANGESAGSSEVNATVVLNGTITVSWTSAAGATSYNVYRGTTTGQEFLVGSTSTTSFLDTGDTSDTTTPIPLYNTTNAAGTMMITDMVDQYGVFRFSINQLPSNMAAADVIVAYLDYNPQGGMIMALHADGKIKNEIDGTTLATCTAPTTGTNISIHYLPTSLLSSAFLTAHPQAGPTTILVMQSGTTYLGSYSTTNQYTWTSTIRGIGGANNGTGATNYTILEGFNWNPDGNGLAPNVKTATWVQVDYNSSRSFGDMAKATLPSSANVALRIIQKGDTKDQWFIQSATFFWDPIVWEFSSDSGKTWWEASSIRNDPNGVLLFPIGLTGYNGLKWRVTSYTGNTYVSHLAIRPWYSGQHSYAEPLPSHLPLGPNVVTSDGYGPIDRDPRWMAWDKPVPRWWWNAGMITKR